MADNDVRDEWVEKAARAELFWTKVTATDCDSCWKWEAALNSDGYGSFWDGHSGRAHRWAYEWLIGSIPEGMVVDHTCHHATECEGGKTCPHRRCVNPWHMELVPAPVNNGRERSKGGKHKTAWAAERTTCRRGHPLDQMNTSTTPADGSRRCKACGREDKQRERARAKESSNA